LAGSITTNANPISFASPINLTAAASLNSNGGNITFSNTVNGGNQLSLSAGVGNIQVIAAVGGTSRIRPVIITSANGVTASAITANAMSFSGITGITSLGALNTSLAAGINLSGTIFNFNGPVTTTGNGVVTLVNTGPLTIPSGSNFNLTGNFT